MSEATTLTPDALELSHEQLATLTDAKRCDAQRRELDHLRIPYLVRRDGSLIVFRRDVDRVRGSIEPREPRLHL